MRQHPLLLCIHFCYCNIVTAPVVVAEDSRESAGEDERDIEGILTLESASLGTCCVFLRVFLFMRPQGSIQALQCRACGPGARVQGSFEIELFGCRGGREPGLSGAPPACCRGSPVASAQGRRAGHRSYLMFH